MLYPCGFDYPVGCCSLGATGRWWTSTEQSESAVCRYTMYIVNCDVAMGMNFEHSAILFAVLKIINQVIGVRVAS